MLEAIPEGISGKFRKRIPGEITGIIFYSLKASLDTSSGEIHPAITTGIHREIAEEILGIDLARSSGTMPEEIPEETPRKIEKKNPKKSQGIILKEPL